MEKEDLSEQPELNFEDELNSVVGEQIEGFSQDSTIYYSHLTDLADKFASKSAVLYLRSQPAREPLSTVRNILLSGTENLTNFNVEQSSKILLAAIIVGEHTLIQYKSSLEDFPKDK